MSGDGVAKVGENVATLALAGLWHREKASDSQLACGATIAEADLTQLNGDAYGPLGAVVGGLDAPLFEKKKQPLDVFEQNGGEISDFAMRVV